MAGLVLDRTVSPARSRVSAPPSRAVVLVAVAFGLLFGAMACAAGLAGGASHGATGQSAIDAAGLMAHADQLAPMAESESQPVPPGSHGDHAGNTSTAVSHPGMACVLPVDLHFPEVSSVSISDSSEDRLVGMSTACSADVDPPVPRFS